CFVVFQIVQQFRELGKADVRDFDLQGINLEKIGFLKSFVLDLVDVDVALFGDALDPRRQRASGLAELGFQRIDLGVYFLVFSDLIIDLDVSFLGGRDFFFQGIGFGRNQGKRKKKNHGDQQADGRQNAQLLNRSQIGKSRKKIVEGELLQGRIF